MKETCSNGSSMREPKTFWNFRADGYDASSGAAYAEAYEKTVERISRYLRTSDAVLDFACGTGLVSIPVAGKVRYVTAIDISDSMIKKAKEKADSENIANLDFQVLDIFDEKLRENSFDAVLACNVFPYIADKASVLSRIRTVLKPGGLLLTAGDCLGQGISREGLRKWWRSHTGKMPFVSFDTEKSLTKAVKEAGFEVLDTEILYRPPVNLFLAAKKCP